MTFTKIVGGFCGALLVFLLGKWAAELIYHGGGHGDGHGQAYVIDTGAEESGSGASEEGPSLAELYAAADIGKGERVFNKCKACHKLEDGANSTGPYLYAVVGRDVGAADGFGYSGALSAVADVWTVENLDAFLINPSGYAPGTTMAFSGLNSAEDRANVIAFIDQTDGDMTELEMPAAAEEAAAEEPAAEDAAAESGENNAADEVTAEQPQEAEVEPTPEAEAVAEAATEEPAAEEAAAEEAAAEEPAAEEAAAEEPAAEEAATEEPAAEEAAAEEVAAEEPAAEEAAAEEPAAEETAAEEAATEEPAAEEAAAEEPAAEEATAEEAAAEEPAAEEMASAEQATEEPAAEEAAAEEPAAEEAAADAGGEASGFAAMVAAADPGAGEKVYRKCKACHALEDGKNRVGPHLYNVVGRDIASAEGFNYSDALQGLEGAWTIDEINAFLENPKGYAAGNKMSFAGLKKEDDRAAVIAYIQSAAN